MDLISPSTLQSPPLGYQFLRGHSVVFYLGLFLSLYIVYIFAIQLIHRCYSEPEPEPEPDLELGQPKPAQENQETPKSGSKRLLLVTHGSGDGMCVICLEEFEQGEACCALPSCNHLYHLECIGLWLEKSKTCPTCRKSTDLNVTVT